LIHWASRAEWKAIPSPSLAKVQADFDTRFGRPYTIAAIPASGNGLNVAADTAAPLNGTLVGVQPSPSVGATMTANDDDGPVGDGAAVEVIYYNMPCIDLARFVRVDNATWTAFLSRQLGFRRKLVLLPAVPTAPPGQNCTVWSMTFWESRAMWHAIPIPDLEATAAKFATAFGEDVPVHRFPTADGLDALASFSPVGGADGPPHPPPVRVAAINGNDVVAYFSLAAGEKDVPGSPEYIREVASQDLLPPALAAMHPEPYTFWFSSEANAEVFAANPWKYIPANGGHCTHGIASRSDLTPELLVDGRVAFTCVNTSRWAVINGSLYMNSCGMYKGFEADPAGDIAKSRELWAEWFGGYHGPINDRCFQDGGLFSDSGSPISHLIPPRCVIN